jgi:hypothetical protein
MTDLYGTEGASQWPNDDQVKMYSMFSSFPYYYHPKQNSALRAVLFITNN